MSRPEFQSTIDAMITEQGEAWLDVLDRSESRNAVIVTDNPDHCFRLTYREGKWIKSKDRLTAGEMAEFFAAFGSHWHILLWSHVEASGELIPVRAFIKHGRKGRGGGFSISVDATNGIPLTEETSKAA